MFLNYEKVTNLVVIELKLVRLNWFHNEISVTDIGVGGFVVVYICEAESRRNKPASKFTRNVGDFWHL